jgi:hypothetical protein
MPRWAARILLDVTDSAFWTQLADSLGERAPSEETVALITEKLDAATTLYLIRSR